MSGRLSTLIGSLVGLGLAAGLLLPEADRDTLVAQATNRWLGAHQVLQADGGATDGSRAGDDATRSLFAVVERLAGDDPAPRIALAVQRDGAPTDDVRLRRAFGSQLNLFNAAREAEGRPPVELVDAGESAPLAVRLEVTVDGSDVSVAGTVEADGTFIGAGATDEDGALPRTVGMPGRAALVPPLLAILVALLLRKVLLALFAGIFAGAAILAYQQDPSLGGALVTGFADVFRVYLANELEDTFRIEIIGFVVALVAMVGVMSRSGGVIGLIELLLGFARTVRSTLFVTWGMGLLIFFDDYANCLLVGNTMRPLTDRLRISREKLAYVVDSTAAPIAGVSLLSTWIAFEVSTYSAHLPAAGITENAYAIFLQTIPFRYYCLFTLAFVLLTILTGRDYGPMRAAEKRARTTGQLVREGGVPMVSDEATRIRAREGMPNRWTHGALPIALVFFATLTSIFFEGGGFAAYGNDPSSLLTLETITQILYDGSGGKPIFVGATAGLVLAAFLSGSNLLRVCIAAGMGALVFGSEVVAAQLARLPWESWQEGPWLVAMLAGFGEASVPYLSNGLAFLAGAIVAGLLVRALAGTVPVLARTERPHLPGREIRDASLASIRALFFAIAILFQAWMIGKVCEHMSTADYLVALLSGSVSPVMLPVLLFIAACLVAFATGSSWSTMSILLPNVVALSASVGEAAGMGALAMVVLCIGAVLEGSIFGDHCSPISDTTVLSSVSSASDHVDHVRTQAPYALTTGVLAIFVGYIPTVALDWWTTPMALGTGVALMLVMLLVVGRRTPDATADDGPTDDEPFDHPEVTGAAA